MSKQVVNHKKKHKKYDDEKPIAKVKGRVDENPADPYLQHEIKTPLFIEDKALTGELGSHEDTHNFENSNVEIKL